MAINKKNQKMFYFSDITKKNFVESRIDDISKKTLRSSSFVIEDILLNNLLPKNNEAKNIVLNCLYDTNNKQNNNIKKTLEALFSANSAGVNWSANHYNFGDLIDYCLKYCDSSCAYNATDQSLDYFITQFSSIIERVENCIFCCIEPDDKDVYSANFGLLQTLLKKIKETPEKVFLIEFYDLIQLYWPMLYDWSITFRFLSSLTSFCKFDESNPIARLDLYDVIEQISNEW